MDVFRRFLAARNIEVAAPWRTRADEYRVPAFGEQRLQAVDPSAGAEFSSKVKNVAAFLIDHGIRQSEFRNLRADHAARFRILIENHAVISERGKVASDSERGRAAADQRDPLAVLFYRWLGQALAYVVFIVGRDSFQAADRHRLLLYADTPAGRLARAVAGAPQNSGKNIGTPVDHVGVGVTPLCDQADIFGNRGVRGTGPLAVHDLVEVIRRRNVGILHRILKRAPLLRTTKTVSRHSL